MGKHQSTSFASSLLISTDTEGVYARSDRFEKIVEALSDFITTYREPSAEVLRFPPVMSRRQLETSGYLRSFPHLLGVVSCMKGDEAEIRDLVERPGWDAGLSATELVLAPAACYPVYPMAAARGPVPDDGLLFDVACYCFRKEATHEIDRLQAFRMREYVFMGTADQVVEFRGAWIERAASMAKLLALPFEIAPASDPFFGRLGRLAAISQLEQFLKFELLVPIQPNSKPTACMSFNYHRDHFAATWDLRTARSGTAHTCCIAFGMERLAMALFAVHGIHLENWPSRVRDALAVRRPIF